MCSSTATITGGECRVCTRSVESLQCLISPLPLGLGALAEQSERGAKPERSCAEALSAAGMRSSPTFLSNRWKNPRLGLRTARRRGATRSKCSAARKGCRTTGRTRAERECARLGS